jgi:uncharacterized protein (TIGR02646 family)
VRRIHKRSQEPPALLAYRKTADPNRSYAAFPSKDALREPLLEDQGWLCCYCMRRIDAGDMKIEHYRSQHRHRTQDLDWSNLLAACSGGEGRPPASQTCDTRKADDDLVLDPRTESVRAIRYLGSGRLVVDDRAHTDDVERRLNLNATELRQARAQAIDNLRRELSRRFGSSSWRRQDLQRYLDALRRLRPFPEFLAVYEYWLEKKLTQR